MNKEGQYTSLPSKSLFKVAEELNWLYLKKTIEAAENRALEMPVVRSLLKEQSLIGGETHVIFRQGAVACSDGGLDFYLPEVKQVISREVAVWRETRTKDGTYHEFLERKSIHR